jgi:branched-chain amino acid transport system substrate-binding protein
LNSRWMAASGCLVAALAVGVSACGGSDDNSSGSGSGSSSSGGGKTLNVYSSLPAQGAGRTQTLAVQNGIKLALDQAGGKAGNFTVKYTPLDDSTAQAGAWTPEATQANARKAAQDSNVGGYIGEFNSGASAISIPILNEAGVPQVSPANTAVGLTVKGPGSTPGEPDKYYPSGTRTYARIVPKDTIQAAALVTVMKQDKCTKVEMANDKEVYGAGLAGNIQIAAKAQGLDIIANDAIDKNAPNYRSLASKAKGAGADCFVYSGITANNGVQLFKDFAAALPDAKLYGPDGVAESGFYNTKDGGVPANVAKRVTVTVATLPPDEYPPEGQKFFDDFKAKYGGGAPDPYSIYGYEAMNLVLDSIKRSNTGEKADIVKALFSTKDKSSVLGTYSIDSNGDTSLTDYGAYNIANNALKFRQTIKAKTT